MTVHAKLAISFLCCFLVSLAGSPSQSQAIVNPLDVPNNRFGIHITNQADIKAAQELVNSNGGEWGYVTIVMPENERDRQYWQTLFDELRQAKLIPIVRLATSFDNGVWRAPTIDDIPVWVEFLQSLNWVTQNRYIILFNEPNHAAEWGGRIDPAAVARVTLQFKYKLKEASQDYFIMPPPPDLAPGDTNRTMNPRSFLNAMHQAEPTYFTQFDGLAVHAYPNPNFAGSLSDQGLNTLSGYRMHRDLLIPFGLPANFPLFITETGWAVSQNRVDGRLSADAIASRINSLYNGIFQDPQIVAITPFILNYSTPPFNQFSWIDPSTKSLTPFARAYQDLPKTAGKPIQYHQIILSPLVLPTELVINALYQVELKLSNTGQSILSPSDIKLNLTSTPGLNLTASQLTSPIAPGQESKLVITLQPDATLKTHTLTYQLEYVGTKTDVFEHQLTTIFPNFLTSLKLWLFEKVNTPSFFHIIQS